MTSLAQKAAAPGRTEGRYFYAVGKRKTAIAQVRLYPDGGQLLVNGRPFQEVFPWSGWQVQIQEPFQATNTSGKFSVVAKLQGGGVSAGAQALRHGIARALVAFDPGLKPALRKRGLVTRDARAKESKKYGLKGARRAPQYSKR